MHKIDQRAQPEHWHDAKQLAGQMAAEGEVVALQASVRACVAVCVRARAPAY
jgi:hypothetical protein